MTSTENQNQGAAGDNGAGDFDFLVGEWDGIQRRRKAWLADCDEWYEMKSSTRCWSVFGGAGNIDEVHFPEQGFTGLTVRLRDVATGDWSILLGQQPRRDPRGAAGHRPLRERRRPVLRRRGARRPGDPGALHLVAHHRRLRPLGTGVLARRRGNLGGQLDRRVHPPPGARPGGGRRAVVDRRRRGRETHRKPSII